MTEEYIEVKIKLKTRQLLQTGDIRKATREIQDWVFSRAFKLAREKGVKLAHELPLLSNSISPDCFEETHTFKFKIEGPRA